MYVLWSVSSKVILDSLQMRPDIVVGRMTSQDAERYGVLSPGLYQATNIGGLMEMTRSLEFLLDIVT